MFLKTERKLLIQNDFSFSFSPTKDNTLFIQRVLGKLFFDFSSKLQPPTSILIRPMTVKILVINPNSSEKVTKNLEKQLLNRKMFNCFYTGPSDSPKEITLPLHYNQKRLYLKILK